VARDKDTWGGGESFGVRKARTYCNDLKEKKKTKEVAGAIKWDGLEIGE